MLWWATSGHWFAANGATFRASELGTTERGRICSPPSFLVIICPLALSMLCGWAPGGKTTALCDLISIRTQVEDLSPRRETANEIKYLYIYVVCYQICLVQHPGHGRMLYLSFSFSSSYLPSSITSPPDRLPWSSTSSPSRNLEQPSWRVPQWWPAVPVIKVILYPDKIYFSYRGM
jgi:hypothetical protein